MKSYNYIAALGAVGMERIFDGLVVIQEKVDGSQFRFGIDAEGDLRIASHKAEIVPDHAGMFAKAVEHVLMMEDRVRCWPPETWFFCEYLQKPKHNALTYDRVPQNNLVLFDMFTGRHFMNMAILADVAAVLHVDMIPVLYQGVADKAILDDLLKTESYLGGCLIEGVVVKNYGELVWFGGQPHYLYCKYVRQDFKEVNKENWAKESGKNKLEEFMQSFRTEARWRKAIQHLAEDGRLEKDPRDIGNLMRAIHDDIVTEESDNIKDYLYQLYIKDVVRIAQRGVPEWYKEQLAKGEV